MAASLGRIIFKSRATKCSTYNSITTLSSSYSIVHKSNHRLLLNHTFNLRNFCTNNNNKNSNDNNNNNNNGIIDQLRDGWNKYVDHVLNDN